MKSKISWTFNTKCTFKMGYFATSNNFTALFFYFV